MLLFSLNYYEQFFLSSKFLSFSFMFPFFLALAVKLGFFGLFSAIHDKYKLFVIKVVDPVFPEKKSPIFLYLVH